MLSAGADYKRWRFLLSTNKFAIGLRSILKLDDGDVNMLDSFDLCVVIIMLLHFGPAIYMPSDLRVYNIASTALL